MIQVTSLITMETPKWNFESTVDVYEPAEDSFLLLDTLEDELENIKDVRPNVIVEIGSGSGVIISALAKALKSTAFCLAIDISNRACQVTQETALLNSVQVDVVQGDLLSCVKSCGLIDVLMFNPPYVVTPDDEISGTLQRAWAGGADGRLVIDRLETLNFSQLLADFTSNIMEATCIMNFSFTIPRTECREVQLIISMVFDVLRKKTLLVADTSRSEKNPVTL